MPQGPLRFFYCIITSMSGCVLFIDGENFLHKVEDILRERTIDKSKVDLALIDLDKLFREALKGFALSQKIFYAARLHIYPETKKKSEELTKLQRKLRNHLVKQGYEFVVAGNVRAQKVNNKVIFKEKGVDVKIAVDLVSLACEKKLKTAILCSSDSDLQPAIKELKERKVEVVYLGFEASPNKGLTYTTNKTILLRNQEIVSALSASSL